MTRSTNTAEDKRRAAAPSESIEDSRDTVAQNGRKADPLSAPTLTQADVKVQGDDTLGYASFLTTLSLLLRVFGAIFIVFGVIASIVLGIVLAGAGLLLFGIAAFLLSRWARSAAQSDG